MRLRAHHLLCIQGFRGYGYNEEFTANLKSIIKAMHSDHKLQAEIVAECDVICLKCPYNKGGVCEKEIVKEMDENVLRKLGLKSGEKVLIIEILNRARELFGDKSELNKICYACSWKDVCGWFCDSEKS